MAKLNGVKTVAEAIEYNGVKYEKVDEKAQAGDILRVDDSDYIWVTDGAYYEVHRVDSSDDPQIIDNDGDSFDGADVEYTLFRKVTEPQTATTQQYREVNRKAEVGEKAKVVGGYSHSFKRGDIVVAITEQSYVTNGVRFRRDDGYVQTLVHTHGDYVVLEPIAELPDDIIEVDGVKYRKVDRDPKVGDFVYATETRNRMTQGKLYPIYEVDGDGDGEFRRDNEYSGYYPATSDGRILVERIATSDDLQRQVSELQTQLAEAESKLATQKAEEEKAKDPRSAFAEGDKVRLISGGDDNPLYGYKDGEVYTVSNPHYHYGNEIEITGGEFRTGYALPSQLAKLSEQEIAEMNRLKVGEYAKVEEAINGCCEVGNIVKITKDDRTGCPFETKHLNGQYAGWHYARSLIRATDEEVAEARSKLEEEKAIAEEVAKWAAIGRKVGEFKVGDVVSYNGGAAGNALNGHKDILTTIVEDSGSIGRADAVRYCLKKPDYVTQTTGTWARGSHLTLVTPTESVVNLAMVN
ncbi:hypothetical protein M5X06_12695 [Paenibacillus alvei]|uniref:Uncharacterized protein n=1 Tax=Paenibacillus alvei TaxID=44250 RepID=A0ABT4GUW8_PAEAL|nr:hypothetical protein [Paenibacillus alvei]MCY9760378.1 hypothetical protein [Paenibacillus alvei]MCY9767670.1 hypothetical protein [Paenibacillus alvei]